MYSDPHSSGVVSVGCTVGRQPSSTSHCERPTTDDKQRSGGIGPLANGADLAPQRSYLSNNAQSFLRYPWLAGRVAASAKNPKRFLSDMLIELLQMVVNVRIRIAREPPHGLLELILPSLASEVGRVQHEPSRLLAWGIIQLLVKRQLPSKVVGNRDKQSISQGKNLVRMFLHTDPSLDTLKIL